MTLAVAVSPKPAQARDGGAVAAGVISGTAIGGAAVRSQIKRNDDGDGYRSRAYARDCYIERRDYEDRYGRLHVRNVRVCP